MKIKFVTNKTAKFKVGEHCLAATDIVVDGCTIPKGTECTITNRHFLSDCYDIVRSDDDKKWILFVDATDLSKLNEV